MKHRYRDKLTGRSVELEDSRAEFIAVAGPNDSEALAPLCDQNVFSVVSSTNKDGVFVLKVVSETESEGQVGSALMRLQAADEIEAVAPALVDADGRTRYALPHRVVVQLTVMTKKQAEKFFSERNAEIVRGFRSPGLYEVHVPNGSVFDFIEELNASDKVRFAEPAYYGVNDQEIRASITTAAIDDAEAVGDPLPWNLARIGVGDAWAINTGAADIVVGVVDGWPEAGHSALQGRFLVDPSDAVAFTEDRMPSAHATNICGLIVAPRDRIAGIAPDAKIVPLVVNLRTQTYAERADAIRFAAQAAAGGRVNNTPVRRLVLSCSWKTSGDIAVIRSAFEDAVRAGVLIVCSAGNDGTGDPHFPSDYSAEAGVLGDGVVSVAATDQTDRKAAYSNFSERVDLSAPGGDGLPFDERDILCADLDNTFTEAAGTSIAAPHVAAVAALMLSVKPDLTPKDVKRLLRASVDDIAALNPSFRGQLGTGRLNAGKAVAAAESSAGAPAPVEPAPVEPDAGGAPGAGEPPETPVASGPNVRVDTVVATEDVAADLAEIRRAVEAIQPQIEEDTGWRLAELTLVRDDDTATIHLN